MSSGTTPGEATAVLPDATAPSLGSNGMAILPAADQATDRAGAGEHPIASRSSDTADDPSDDPASTDREPLAGRRRHRPTGESLQGRVLGDFRLGELLGQGGFGDVYAAEQLSLGRAAVIKVLRQRRADAQTVQRFLTEARLAARLDHPYAAHVYSFGHDEDLGVLWIAMELIRGIHLRQLLRERGPLAVASYTGLLERICEVVHTAHELGIVHRDIKPENIMVIARSGRLLPKLLDLGIAKLSDATSPRAPRAVDPDDLTTSLELHGVSSIAHDSLRSDPSRSDSSSGGQSSATRRGAVMGTPPYMSPEQWTDTATVGRATDIYALGVLSYQMLTGRLPFSGRALRDLRQAHLFDPVPPLGDGFPRELDQVLATAMAKRPEQRHPTVLAFAEAFSAAAGVRSRRPVAELDGRLRQRWTHEAPRPVAACFAVLGAVQSSSELREAMTLIVRSLCHYTGLLALACHRSLGQRQGELASAVRELIIKLRDEGLGSGEWLRLAREICRPYARQRELFPVPELVSLFFPDGDLPPRAGAGQTGPGGDDAGGSDGTDDGGAGRAHDVLDLVAQLTREVGSSFERGDERERLRAFTHALEAFAFLRCYPLVVQGAQGAEQWIGTATPPEPAMPVPGLEDGQVALADADGHPVLSLTPLLQVHEPSPGAPRELFLLAGSRGRDAHLLSIASGCEWRDPEAWTALRDSWLDATSEEAAVADRSSPYPGLASYRSDSADHFFGRERETQEVCNHLRAHPLVAIVGASGSGKSSFVQAGVLPALAGQWNAITLRPGSTPLWSLATALRGLQWGDAYRGGAAGEIEDPVRQLRQDPGQLGQLLRRLATRERRGCIVVVDQFEELFTLCRDPGEQHAFVEALVAAARTAAEPVRLVLTLRDDFLASAEQLEPLRSRLTRNVWVLATPGRPQLRRILTEPAHRLGYQFEDEQIVNEMVEEVAERPGALPLLSFAAASLWAERDRTFRKLKRAAYRQIGGVAGALAQYAEHELAAMSTEQRRLVREVFRNLVTPEGTRQVIARADLMSAIGGGEAAERVLERLLTARLLVATGDEEEPRIEVIHEALFSAWPRLVEWRQQDVEFARLRAQLRQAATQWRDRGRATGLLWRGEALAEYRLWRGRYGGQLSEVEEAFAAASLREEARGRRLRRGAIGAALGTLGSASVVLLWMNGEVRQSAAQAAASAAAVQERLLASYEERGRRELVDGYPLRALAYLSEAAQGGRHGPALRYATARAARTFDQQQHVLRGHDRTVTQLDSTAGGARLLSGDTGGAVKLWDARTGALVASLPAHRGEVLRIVTHRGRPLALSAGADGEVRVWNTDTATLLRTLAHPREVWSARFSPDGERLVTADADGRVRVWEISSGRQLLELTPRDGAGRPTMVGALAFARSGQEILVGASDGAVHCYTPAGALRWTARAHGAGVGALDAAPDSDLLVSGGMDRVLAVIDGATGAVRRRLSGHEGPIYRVHFLPRRPLVLSASPDGTARLWDLQSGLQVSLFGGRGAEVTFARPSDDGARILTAGARVAAWATDSPQVPLTQIWGHTAEVTSAAFLAGDLVATGSADTTIRVWRLADDQVAAGWRAHEGVLWDASLTRAGDRAVTASGDGSARVWSSTGALLHELRGHQDDVTAVALSPGGDLVASGSEDSTAIVWNARTGERLHVLRGHQAQVGDVEFSSDGATVLSSSWDGTAKLWHSRDGQLVHTLAGADGPVFAGRFHPRRPQLLTAHADGALREWDLHAGRLLATRQAHESAIFQFALSHDGRRAATASLQTVRLWDLEHWRLLGTCEGHRDLVRSIDFSPDGALLVTTGEDRSALVWNAQTCELLERRPVGEPGTAISFRGDGRQLLAANLAGLVQLWNIDYDRRSPRELAILVRCQVGLQVVDEKVVAADRRGCPP